jgi:hypothetical protein
MKAPNGKNKGRLITGFNEGNISNIHRQKYIKPPASGFWGESHRSQKCVRKGWGNNLTANVR